jgi:hypothetical protein
VKQKVKSPAVAFLIIAAVAGCGQGRRSQIRHQPARAHGVRHNALGAGRGEGLPTGAQLARLLPPHSGLPPGWTLAHGPGVRQNLNPKFNRPIADLGPIAAFKPCTNWTVSLGADHLMFLWEMSRAYVEVRPHGLPATGTPVTLQIADFLPGDAVKELAWDTKFAARCRSYRSPLDGSPVTVSAGELRGLGDESLHVLIRNPYHMGGMLFRARVNVLLVRVGADMIGVSQSGSVADPGDPVTALGDLKHLAMYYIRSVSHLSSG